MKVTGKLLEMECNIHNNWEDGWIKVNHRIYDIEWVMTLRELKELSQLTEALLQELKGEQE